MIRLSLLVISIFSLIYGVYFLFYPYNFIILTEAESINVAWLRNIGASITGLLFIGLLITYINPNKSLKLIRVITITSILQTISLIYSRFIGEFSAKNNLLIDITIYSAILVTIYLVFITIKYKKIFD
tara:strand:- start:1979 stop:2362 length:384 start_codon:yes stop_codon:yes gene_type:complete